MLKNLCAFVTFSLAAGTVAAGGRIEHSLDTVWEALWHQSGQPTQVAKWAGPIRVHIKGMEALRYRDNVMAALREVTGIAGIQLIDEPDDLAANLHVEIVGQDALRDSEPCYTRSEFDASFVIRESTVQMRASDVYRCAHHEAMHVMGLRGHPSGDTVLSYFTKIEDRLQPMDIVLLRGWYRPQMKPGMTPFEALPILVAELEPTAADRPAIDLFYRTVWLQSFAFASGGEAPEIVKRSGKLTEAGLMYGRAAMHEFLLAALKNPNYLAVKYQSAVSAAKKAGGTKASTQREVRPTGEPCCEKSSRRSQRRKGRTSS